LVRSFIHACALDVRLLLLLVNVQLSLMLQAYCHHHILSVLHFHSTLCRQTPLSSGHATNHATFQSPITAGFNNPPVMMLMQPSGFAHAPPGVFPAHFQPMLPSTAGANLKRLRPSELSGGSIAFNGWLSHHICSCTFPLFTNCSIFMPCIVLITPPPPPPPPFLPPQTIFVFSSCAAAHARQGRLHPTRSCKVSRPCQGQ
jgi:hypothetical protein